jgi:hypothetical protein
LSRFEALWCRLGLVWFSWSTVKWSNVDNVLTVIWLSFIVFLLVFSVSLFLSWCTCNSDFCGFVWFFKEFLKPFLWLINLLVHFFLLDLVYIYCFSLYYIKICCFQWNRVLFLNYLTCTISFNAKFTSTRKNHVERLSLWHHEDPYSNFCCSSWAKWLNDVHLFTQWYIQIGGDQACWWVEWWKKFFFFNFPGLFISRMLRSFLF